MGKIPQGYSVSKIIHRFVLLGCQIPNLRHKSTTHCWIRRGVETRHDSLVNDVLKVLQTCNTVYIILGSYGYLIHKRASIENHIFFPSTFDEKCKALRIPLPSTSVISVSSLSVMSIILSRHRVKRKCWKVGLQHCRLRIFDGKVWILTNIRKNVTEIVSRVYSKYLKWEVCSFPIAGTYCSGM